MTRQDRTDSCGSRPKPAASSSLVLQCRQTYSGTASLDGRRRAWASVQDVEEWFTSTEEVEAKVRRLVMHGMDSGRVQLATRREEARVALADRGLVTWGTVSIWLTLRRLLANALQDIDNQHFVLLSDRHVLFCVPLHNFDYVYDYLMGTNLSFIDCFYDPGPHGNFRYSKNMLPEVTEADFRKGLQVSKPVDSISMVSMHCTHTQVDVCLSFIAQEIALQLGVERNIIFIGEELEMMLSFLMTGDEEQDKNKVLLTWVKQVRAHGFWASL
nr:unnamed protein product [Digitaria exilis]